MQYPVLHFHCKYIHWQRKKQFYYQERYILEAFGYLATASGVRTSFTNTQKKRILLTTVH